MNQQSETSQANAEATLLPYRRWFYAAAVYNLVWGVVNILFPRQCLRILGVREPVPAPVWQVVGMLVMVYAPAYWWAGRYPERHRHVILIGLLGKVLGPIGFAWAGGRRQLPARFGLTILTNDLIWRPAFGGYLRAAARQTGGWQALLRGE